MIPCTMGVGCDETGMCYAACLGEPEMCCRTERDRLDAAGFNADTTPVDTLMRQPGLGLAVAWEMEHGDDPYPE